MHIFGALEDKFAGVWSILCQPFKDVENVLTLQNVAVGEERSGI